MKRSPSAAVFLSLLPGLGHIYVGQATKGFLIGLTFFLTIHLTSEASGPFGVLIPFLVFYAMVDAHRTAVEVNRIVAAGGTPPRGPELAVTKWWGYVLIGLGVLFTLENFDLFDFDWIARLWPLGLIALGIYVLRRPHQGEASSGFAPPEPPPPTSPPEQAPVEERGDV
jgi:TM2 domain-containing membrane protein YozV